MGHERLREVLGRLERKGAERHPVVVFDLDSTLFATQRRNLRILEEFAADHERRFPGIGAAVGTLAPADLGWQVLEPLRSRGFAPSGLPEAFLPFWTARFFTDEYVVLDEPHPGAVEYVNACHERGALVYYLTGRHVEGMSLGTARSLTQHGFPFWRGRTVLHLKPSFDLDDTAYKADALADIRSHGGEVVATFENEPGNANLFHGAFPDGVHFLLETEHSPGAPEAHPEVVRTPDFRL